jgi:hypothetical protein
MTTLASWGTTDGHDGIASLYIASDSRACNVVAGKPIPEVRSDEYTKTFISPETPDIFGVYGIVTYAPAILQKVISQLQTLRESSQSVDYPKNVSEAIAATRPPQAGNDDFEIIHGYRMGTGNFGCSRISVQIRGTLVKTTFKPLIINAKKHFELEWATGGPHIFLVRQQDEETDARGFSRWHWQTIYDTITTTKDPFSGGAPQLVGLYREGNGKQIGVFYKNKRYLAGKPMDDTDIIPTVDWRDHLFQRVSGSTGELLQGAQRHARNLKRAIRDELNEF